MNLNANVKPYTRDTKVKHPTVSSAPPPAAAPPAANYCADDGRRNLHVFKEHVDAVV